MLQKKDYSTKLNYIIGTLDEISVEEKAVVCEVLHEKYHLTYIEEKEEEDK